MNKNFEELIVEFREFQAIAFSEMHRLIDECDKAEAHALEVLRQCQ